MFLTLVSKLLLAYNVFTLHQRDDHYGNNGIDDENNADDDNLPQSPDRGWLYPEQL